MTTTVYSARATNWALFWGVNVLVAATLAAVLLNVRAVVPLVVTALVLFLVNLTMASVRTTAGPNGVVVSYGVFGLPRFRFPHSGIERAEAVDLPTRALGGFGVHWSPWRGMRLTIRSGPQLRLHRRDGGLVTISAENPDAAATVVNAYTH